MQDCNNVGFKILYVFFFLMIKMHKAYKIIENFLKQNVKKKNNFLMYSFVHLL